MIVFKSPEKGIISETGQVRNMCIIIARVLCITLIR